MFLICCSTIAFSVFHPFFPLPGKMFDLLLPGSKSDPANRVGGNQVSVGLGEAFDVGGGGELGWGKLGIETPPGFNYFGGE